MNAKLCSQRCSPSTRPKPLGFTWGTIEQRTGLTKGQVGRRLKIAGISTRDYRTGQSDLARKVMDLAHQDSREYFNTMVSKVRRYLIEEKAA